MKRILAIVAILLVKNSVQDPSEFVKTYKIKISMGAFKDMNLKSVFQTVLPNMNVSEIGELELVNVTSSQVLENSPFQGFDNLITLRISDSSIKEFPESTFQGLQKLSHLDVVNVSLSAINPNLFTTLNSLTMSVLKLTHTDLDDLPPNLFDNLAGLRFLFLSSNKLHSLPSELFRNLTSLTKLDLSNNHLESLPAGIFDALGDIEKKLNLSHNSISRLEAGIFKYQSRLYELDLSFNNVSYIDKSVFENMDSLRRIILSRTFVAPIDIPWALFSKCRFLNEIKMSHNQFRSQPPALPRGLFHNLPNLITLELSFNELTQLDADIFEPNPNDTMATLDRQKSNNGTMLENLYVDNNQLRQLDPRIFNKMLSLKKLDISNNYLNNMTGSGEFSVLEPCKNITHIFAQNNSISKVYKDWLQIKTLKTLDLSFNPISSSQDSIEFEFVSNVNLMMKNSIFIDGTSVNVEIRIEKDEYLTDEADKKVPLDTSESCKNNNCSCLAETFPKDKRISIDCIRFNREELLENLPNPLILKTQQGWRTEFSLPNCGLDSLSKVRSYLQEVKLTKLNLTGNKLATGSLSELPKLPDLEVLDLSDNLLESLDEKATDNLRDVKNIIKLGDNPWKCDCNLGALHKFIQNHKGKIKDLDRVTCASDNRIIGNLAFTEICDPSFGFWAPMLAGCVFLIGVLLASMYYGYQYELEIKVWLFSHKGLRWLVTEKDLDRDKKYDAFISYASPDEDFVIKELIPNLETGENPYRLCIHYRDWPVGGHIPTQIYRSVADSRRTVIILSPNFLGSNWGRQEFQEAYLRAMAEKCPRLIVIMLKDIGDVEKLDDELKAYISTNTYLKWGDAIFWKRLRYALPHNHSAQIKPKLNSCYIQMENQDSSDGELQMKEIL